MGKRNQDKIRDKRLNSGPSTRLVSRGGRTSSNRSRSRSNKRSRFNRSNSNKGLNSYHGSNPKPRNPYSRRQIIIMAIVLIAFISGILMGSAFIFGDLEDQASNFHEPVYQNVTKNISQYNESDNVTFDINDTENNTPVKNNVHVRNRSGE